MNTRRTIERFGRAAFFHALLVTGFIGCKAPIFHLAVERPAPPVVAVRIDDQRPTWERKFYLGGSDKRLFQNDVTFIPVERIDPSPWELIQRQLETRFAYCGVQPQRVDVCVRSCRVVENHNLDAVEIGVLNTQEAVDDATRHAGHEAERQRNRQLGIQDDSDCSDEILGEMALGAFYLLGRTTMEGARYVGHWVRILPGKAGPPSQINLDDYPRGVTFELEGDAIVTFATGEQKSVPIRCSENVLARKGSGDSLRLAVEHGTSNTADRIVRHALNLPPPNLAVSPADSSATGDAPILPLVTQNLFSPAPAAVNDEIKRLEQSQTQRNAQLIERSMRR